jgi:hypothetical protein
MKENNATIKLLERSRKTVTLILIFQIFLLLLTFAFLFITNTTQLNFFNVRSSIILNSALFGFAGCLIFFSRKSYVYLITKKFLKIVNDNTMNTETDDYVIYNIFYGYYLYLTLRPFVGLIIGPIIYMLVLTGLITFIKASIPMDAELSRSGRYVIYFLSFIGGHASSDILDYFSKLARKIVEKNSEKIS